MSKREFVILAIGNIGLFLISCSIAYSFTWISLIIYIAVLLLIVGFLPICKGYESVWLFVLSVMSSIPINLKITELMASSIFFTFGIPMIDFITKVKMYLVFLSIEELLLGVVGRFVWKKQDEICLE